MGLFSYLCLEKHFGVSFVLIRFMFSELLEVDGWVGHGLVLVWFESFVLHLVFFFTIAWTREVVWHLIYPSPLGVRELQLSVQTCSKGKWLREKRFGNFSVHDVRLTVLELASRRRRKKC